jgi:hypothetical protein
MIGIKQIHKNGESGRLKKCLLHALVGLTCLAALAPAANASTILNISDGHGAGPFGTVTLTQLNSTTVGVDVTLFSNYEFVDTGSHDSFGFNLSGSHAITYYGMSAGFGAGNGFGNGFTGGYAYSLACIGCGPGGSSPLAGPLDFQVHAVTGSLSVNDFIANANGHMFVADVIGPARNGAPFTGLVVNGATSAIPEPVSLPLVGGGLFVLGVLRKRLPG